MKLQSKLENHKTDNFAFLKDGLGELYQQALLAERYYYTDPQSTLAKIRLFVELSIHELGKHFKLRPPVTGDLANKIKMLDASSCVDDWVIDAMNALRHDGNRSVHLSEVNGGYVAQLKVARSHLKKNMQSLFELACYVSQIVLGRQVESHYMWHEPASDELSTWVSDALKGSKDASYHLAENFYAQLLEMSEQTGKSRWWQKEHYADKQADLAYWLEKAHRQGHPQTWLLFAKCYANKLLVEEGGRDAKACFKQALNHDEQGDAAYEYGAYLVRREECKLGEQYLAEAALKGHSAALSIKLHAAFRTEIDKAHWLEQGLKHHLPEAHSASTWMKLEAYQLEQSEASLKALRSALVEGEARRAPGILFIKAYLDLIGSEKEDNAALIALMVKHYGQLPEYVPVESRFYPYLASDPQHYGLMLATYHDALRQASSDIDAATVKFQMVQSALDLASEKFKRRGEVKTPAPIPVLLKEAADAGLPEARALVNSAHGKAVLKRIGFTNQGKMQKNAAEKQKNKRKRKLASKAKRK